MLTQPVTKNGAPHLLTSPAAREEEALRNAARKQVERVRNFKLHLTVFLVAMPIITGIWALTEYMNADGWPDRFSESAGQGNWNPWILWVLFIWGGILAIDGVKTYFRRAPSEAEIEREIARLTARR
jgi:2TM domain